MNPNFTLANTAETTSDNINIRFMKLYCENIINVDSGHILNTRRSFSLITLTPTPRTKEILKEHELHTERMNLTSESEIL